MSTTTGLSLVPNPLERRIHLGIKSMWFDNQILQGGSISSVGLLGKVLDSQARDWWKDWFRFTVGACLVEEADLQDCR